MLVVTNRNIVEGNFNGGVGDEGGFGEKVNAKGPNELRLAHAKKTTNGWILELVQEPANLSVATAPSAKEFENLAKRCTSKKVNCLFYVHGYDKPFPETLEQGGCSRNGTAWRWCCSVGHPTPAA